MSDTNKKLKERFYRTWLCENYSLLIKGDILNEDCRKALLLTHKEAIRKEVRLQFLFSLLFLIVSFFGLLFLQDFEAGVATKIIKGVCLSLNCIGCFLTVKATLLSEQEKRGVFDFNVHSYSVENIPIEYIECLYEEYSYNCDKSVQETIDNDKGGVADE